MLVLHPLQEELPEWIDRWLAAKAIINVLIICIGPEPQFVAVAKEQQAEQKKEDDESEGRRVGSGHDYTAGSVGTDCTAFSLLYC